MGDNLIIEEVISPLAFAAAGVSTEEELVDKEVRDIMELIEPLSSPRVWAMPK